MRPRWDVEQPEQIQQRRFAGARRAHHATNSPRRSGGSLLTSVTGTSPRAPAFRPRCRHRPRSRDRRHSCTPRRMSTGRTRPAGRQGARRRQRAHRERGGEHELPAPHDIGNGRVPDTGRFGFDLPSATSGHAERLPRALPITRRTGPRSERCADVAGRKPIDLMIAMSRGLFHHHRRDHVVDAECGDHQDRRHYAVHDDVADGQHAHQVFGGFLPRDALVAGTARCLRRARAVRIVELDDQRLTRFSRPSSDCARLSSTKAWASS